jgi:glucan biosynthesis protein
MQDITSNAMTEVALGLSMAFFSLLIVALLSMSVAKDTHRKLAPEKLLTEIKKQQAISITKNESKQQSQLLGKDKSQFAFYHNGKFYDKTLTIRSIESYQQQQPLVIAVDKNTVFSQIFSLKQQINHPKLSITLLNKAWLTRLNNLYTGADK